MKALRTQESPLHPAIIPAAVIAAGLAGAPTELKAAPGDLDPTFGEVGRVELDLSGATWSIEAEEDGYLLTGAVESEACFYYYYYCDLSTFQTRVLPDGSLDDLYAPPELEGLLLYDAVRQADGKTIGVGQVGTRSEHELVVRRLLTDGSLDSAFGAGGIVQRVEAEGQSSSGRAVLVEPDGRIVIAGRTGANQLLVTRLLDDGSVDASFATDGTFISDAAVTTTSHPKLVRVADGGYRVTVQQPDPGDTTTCGVMAMTSSGTLDTAFGSDGIASPGSAHGCSALLVDADGNLLLGGRGAQGGVLMRLLPDGVPDPTFSGTAVASSLTDVASLAIAPAGQIVAAGRDRDGEGRARIVRLNADGGLDTAFGTGGSAYVLFDSDWPLAVDVHELVVLDDGGVLLGGATSSGFGGAFASRLKGDGAGGGPGVITQQTGWLEATEQSGEAVVTLQRIGGSTGRVSVDVTTLGGDWEPALEDVDYTAVQTTLTWEDGESGDKQVVVSLAADSDLEFVEHFLVALDNPQGGAGLGTRVTDVTIRGDGYPNGIVTVYAAQAASYEGSQHPQFVVERRDYAEGAISVTLRVMGGTATPGVDFDDSDIVLEWADGDSSPKYVLIQAPDDDLEESGETIVVELSDATGGARVSATSTAQTTLRDPAVPPNNDAGGGRFDLLAMLLAVLMGLCGRLRDGASAAARRLDRASLADQRRPLSRRSASR